MCPCSRWLRRHRVHVVNEYLREDQKVHETVFTCSYGAQVEYFKQMVKIS